MRILFAILFLTSPGLCVGFSADETLPPLLGNTAPRNFEELWAGFDPRAEPLDVEVLKEWEQDGVAFRIVRYRIGVFRGKPATMAAIYGYPIGGGDLPGLVQIHGGGQYAHSNAVLTNAKRGYATISIAWAGRIDAPGYRVTPREVQLFWDNATSDPDYKLTTDWGGLDAYHAPCRNPKNAFAHVSSAEWTLDAVDSPRNNPWFLCTLGARRALTFLEQQAEVDGDKLGVYGHSMGGKLTVLTTGSDSRVRASAPSCGGVSDRDGDTPMYRGTIGDDVYLKRVTCPIMFLSPANDFHGRIDDLQTAFTQIQSSDWRATCSAHHNHQDNADFEVATQLWFDQHLKGRFRFPQTPQTEYKVDSGTGVPSLMIHPDASKPVLSVDVFYTQQGRMDGLPDDRDNTMARFWHHSGAAESDGRWVAELPLFTTDKPLWVYANVAYALDEPVTGAGYYYRTYTAKGFSLSSAMTMLKPEVLKAAGVKATLQYSGMIESFADGWDKEWFTYRPEDWARSTHKIHDPQWAAPAGAKLALQVRSADANALVVGLDDFAAEVRLNGGEEWQGIVLAPTSFANVLGQPLADWSNLRELRLGSQDTLRGGRNTAGETRKFGGPWNGPRPEFRNLRWEN